MADGGTRRDMLITTNAAGAINEGYRVDDFCIMTDQLNFTGRNPITGTEPDAMAPRFFSMLDAYDPALRQLARRPPGAGHSRAGGRVPGLLGPSFETPAEIRIIPALGAPTPWPCPYARRSSPRAPCGPSCARHLAREQHGLRGGGRESLRRGVHEVAQTKPTSAGSLKGYFARYSAFRS